MSEISRTPPRSLPASLQAKLKQLGVEDRPQKRRANTVFLLLDCSASMDGSKLKDAVMGATEFCAQAIQSRYRTGIVTFSSTARCVCEATDDVPRATGCLVDVASSGSTDIAGAITLGAHLLSKEPALRSRVLVLFTDGQPDDESAALRAAADAKALGIEIICKGTADANLEFLSRLASERDMAEVFATHQLRDGIARAARLLPGARDPT
jgi:Ca-activated chloride channel homolog